MVRYINVRPCYWLAILLVLFTSCRTSKKAAVERDSIASERIYGTMEEKAVAAEEKATTTNQETNATIEYVTTEYYPPDSTGQVGAVKSVTTARAVIDRAEKMRRDERKKEENKVQRADSAIVTTQQKITVTPVEKQEIPWYNKILIAIGTLCCLAAILWALFLYLKRKF